MIIDLKLDDPINIQKENLDLCCGDGRIIRKVILPLNNKFKHHTGVDFSSNLTKEFREILNSDSLK